MNIKLLLKILIKWGFETKNYDMILFIYTNFNIGIPVTLLYKLEDKNMFSSLNSFISENRLMKKLNDEYLKELFNLFLSSKYRRLKDWDNRYGYSLLNND
jgi:hypothetical protein